MECEEGILAAGLRAAAQGLPFLPWRGGVGTSLPDVNPDLKVIQDPIKGETLLAVPAIEVDVAILHAAASDAYGNVQHVGGPGWIDLFLQRAADRTIVQVEKVIANEDVRADPWATTIAGTDAVVRPSAPTPSTAAATTCRTGRPPRPTSTPPPQPPSTATDRPWRRTWPATAGSRQPTATTWSGWA